MRFERNQIINMALAITEASWVFAITSVIGLTIGLDESPVPWVVIVIVIVLAMWAGWIASGLGGDLVSLALIQGGFGLVVAYTTVAISVAKVTETGIDAIWIVHLIQWRFDQLQVVTAISMLFVAAFLWRRGLRLIADSEAWERLHHSFRWGIAIIAIALIIEIAADREIGMRLVIFPFFGAALGGMAIGRLAEQGAWASAQDIWGRVIGFTVGGILVLGFFLGVMGASYGGGPLGLIKDVLVAIREVVITVVGWVLTPVVGALFAFISWLRDRFNPDPPPPLELETGGFRPATPEPGDLPDDSTESLIEMIAQILAYPAAALLLLLVLWLMIRGFKKMQKNRAPDPSDERESIRGDSDARRDLADLFYRLLPGFMRGGGVGKSSRRYPTDEPGITEIFLLYFRYLEASVRGGANLDSHLTPSEMEGRIAEALPGAPVGLMTARFEAACYGHEPSSEEDLRALTSGLGDQGEAED